MSAGSPASAGEPDRVSVPGDPSEAPASPPESLNRQVLRGVAWTGAVKWGFQLVSWPVTLLTAKLLSPADYGYVALVTVFTRMLQIVTEGGIGAALVAGPALDQRRLRQVHTLVLGVALTAALAGCVLAYPVGRFYGSSTVGWVMAAYSLTILCDGLMVVPSVVLRRRFAFKDLAVIEAGRHGVDQAVTLLMALLGARFWSLVGGYAAGAVVHALLLTWRVRTGLARPALAEIAEPLRTGRQVATRALADTLALGTDRLIGGRLVSQAGLGWYSFAGTLAWAPADKITGIVMRVTPSLFGQAREDLPRLRGYLARITETLTLVTMPVFVGLSVTAGEVVAALLGAKWQGMAPVLAVLALYACQSETFAPISQVAVSVGQGRAIAQNGVAGLLAYPLAFLGGGLLFGEVGLAAGGFLVSTTLNLRLLLVVRRAIALPLRGFAASLAPAVTSSALMAGAVLAARAPIARAVGAPWARLALEVALGAAVYAAALVALHRPRVADVLAFVRRARAGAA